MRLHHCIDVIDDMTPYTPLHEPMNVPEMVPRTAEYLRATATKAVQFDFGDLNSISKIENDELYEYSKAMARVGLFRLPFPSCVFSFHQGGLELLLLAEQEADESEIYLTFIAALSSNREAAWVLSGTKFSLADICEGHAFNAVAVSLVKKGAVIDVNNSVFPFELCECAPHVLFTLCAILHAEGAEIATVPAPVRLNKKRAKLGRAPVGEIREVFIRVGGKRYAASGMSTGTGGARRMHWRRGHIRRLSDNRVTSVRPALIGKIAGAEAPAKPEYTIVRKAG